MQQMGMNASQTAASPRRPWSAPRVDDLPRLSDLTLQTGIPGDCVPGDPSSCFG
jgi:hypothetical protein